MAVSALIRGTILLTAASFLSKFLGIIYVIPFNALVGETGGALFSYAYIPYNILISISTIGIPLGVSKFVSRYNALGDYHTSRRVFRSGVFIMGITGVIAFLVMFFGSELIASFIPTEEGAGQISHEDIAYVIKMVSFANLIIPSMSIVRGFFQGNQSMEPTAVSQVVEQIIRIVFLLVSAYVIINVLDKGMELAVGFATFAAFVGAIASCIVLYFYWKSKSGHLNNQLAAQTVKPAAISNSQIMRELFSYAGPFVLTGIATTLYQFVDQFTFKRAMIAIGQGDISDLAFGVINFTGHKIVSIPMTLATGMSLAIIPAITQAFTHRDRKTYVKQINQAVQIILVLIIPAAAGIALLHNEAYAAFYNIDNIDIAGVLLGWYAPVALLYSLYAVTAAILQGVNEQRFSVVSLTAGLLTKIFLNIPLIHLFGAKGAIFGTMLAVGVATFCNIWRVRSALRFPMRQLYRRTLLILIFTAVMSVVVLVIQRLLGLFITYENGQLASAFILAVSAAAGGIVYLYLAYRSTLLERVLGNRIGFLERLLKKRRG